MPSVCIGAEEDDEEQQAGDGEDIDEDDSGVIDRGVPFMPVPDLRVIFLDIDKVLNTRPDPRFVVIEGGPCSMLRRLIEASGATLVLTSPWRRHHSYVLEVLKNFGVFEESQAPEELQRTPRHGDAARRDLEILQWLGAHRGRVAAWVALDGVDLQSFPSAPRLQGHAIRVDAGLGPAEVQAALDILCQGLSHQGLQPSLQSHASKESAEASAGAFRMAAAWDAELAGKMEALLGALALPTFNGFAPPSRAKPAPEVPQTSHAGSGPRSDAREFDELEQAVRQRFS